MRHLLFITVASTLFAGCVLCTPVPHDDDAYAPTSLYGAEIQACNSAPDPQDQLAACAPLCGRLFGVTPGHTILDCYIERSDEGGVWAHVTFQDNGVCEEDPSL